MYGTGLNHTWKKKGTFPKMDILNKPHKNHKKPFKLLCGKLISFSGDYSRQKDYKFTSQQS